MKQLTVLPRGSRSIVQRANPRFTPKYKILGIDYRKTLLQKPLLMSPSCYAGYEREKSREFQAASPEQLLPVHGGGTGQVRGREDK